MATYRRKHPNMPVIARRGRLKVLMYYNDHAPPHIHVDAGDDAQLVVDIQTPDIPPGILSRQDKRDILSWIQDNETELLENWRRAEIGEELVPIPFP